MKQLLIQLLSNDTALDEHFVKQKLAALVVEVAKREFPQRWPELFHLLMKTASQGVSCYMIIYGLTVVQDTQAELCLMVVTGLGTHDDQLTSRRKSEIFSGIKDHLDSSLQFVYSCLDTHFASVKSLLQLPAQESGSLRQHLRLVDACLQALISFTEWVPPR